MVFLSPEGSSNEERYPLAPRHYEKAEGLRLGLLGNSKLNADAVLVAIGELLAQRYNITNVTHREKPNFSRPAPQEIIEALAADSDIVLAGVGD